MTHLTQIRGDDLPQAHAGDVAALPNPWPPNILGNRKYVSAYLRESALQGFRKAGPTSGHAFASPGEGIKLANDASRIAVTFAGRHRAEKTDRKSKRLNSSN